MLNLNKLTRWSAVMAALVWSTAPLAQVPGRTITFIVPVSGGTAVDRLARAIQPHLAQRLGATIVIDNRTGASGAIGMAAAARAPNDGSTVLVSPSTMAMIALSQKQLTFDPEKDFTAVARLANIPYSVVVTPTLPIHNVQQLIAAAKASPGKLNFASPGIGTPQHLIGELFKQATGINTVHVPYKTTSGAVTDLAGGQVQYAMQAITAILPLAKAGKVRIIASITDTRTPWTADVPTLRESGVDGVNINSWVALFLPAGASKELAERYSREVAAILAMPQVSESLLSAGIVTQHGGPDEMAALLRRDSALWKRVVTEGKIAL